MPGAVVEVRFDQLYHQVIPGEVAVGAKALEGTAFEAMPRLQERAPPSPASLGGGPASTVAS
jgi:hypothetical protein